MLLMHTLKLERAVLDILSSLNKKASAAEKITDGYKIKLQNRANKILEWRIAFIELLILIMKNKPNRHYHNLYKEL